MCGIAGIFRQKGISQEDLDLIQRMNQIQKHRGPDDEGLFSDNYCVLGHQRLAIIDLSQAGHQPYISDDGRYLLVFNGEIYNYIELKKKLKSLGWHFKTKTDTEVLMNVYLHFGKDCLSMLNGMFAFVIYDSKKHTLFMARDRFGIKPLYYTDFRSTLYFASEIKALHIVPGLNRSINYQSLFDYLVFNRTDIYDETFLNEIKRIPKGHYGVVDQKGIQIKQWWNPKHYVQNSHHTDINTIVQHIHEQMISSVQLRMRSDVPVGSCLSGGLDSSIIIGILFQHHIAPNHYPSFTASFPGEPIDETRYIQLLNHQYPFINYQTFPNANQAFTDLEAFVYTNDEPTTNYSFYSQYQVMKLAKKLGVTVLLDGQGGDENFAGYQYFHGFHLYGLYKKRKYLTLITEWLNNILRKQDKAAYLTFLFQLLPDTKRKQFLFKTLPFLELDFFNQYISTSRIYNEFFDVNDLNDSIVRHFQYKLEHLLRIEDRNSMAFSLEARLPYLDYRLVEYVLGISECLKIKRGETKHLQKKSIGQYTIPQILNRRDKIGFGTPGSKWMQTDSWKRLTYDNYAYLYQTFPDIFKKRMQLAEKGFDRWKINQLATWKKIFV
jgi:asparagine synthase (glutamine-hydrolysing)